MARARAERNRRVVLTSSAPIWLVLLVGLCLAVTPSAGAWQVHKIGQNQALGQYVLAEPVPSGEPFTMTARLRLNLSEAEVSGRSEEIWLAGVAGADGERPALLALALHLEGSAWFPMWNLCLQSEGRLLPSQENRLPLDWRSMVPPGDGVGYTVALAYDPSQGVLSTRIAETATGRVQYAQHLTLNEYTGPLYPGVGYQRASGEGQPLVEIDELTVQRTFVPVGTSAQVLTRKSTDQAFFTVIAGDRRDEWALDLSLPSRDLEDDIVLLLDDGVRRSELLRLHQGGRQVIPLPASSMPAGTVDLVLEYSAGGTIWELDRRQLRVGAVDTCVETLNLAVGRDGEPELAGIVSVVSDGDVPPFELGFTYNVQVPGRVGPLHEQWSRMSGSVTLPVSDVGTAPVELPFRLPLGSLAERVDGREVFVALKMSAELGVPFFTTSGLARVALGERAPAFPRVGDYIVLRGDLHTHTILSDGELAPQDRVWESYMYGYDTLSLTDHRTMDAYDYGKELAHSLGLTLIRGFETGIDGKQHLIVLGADPTYRMRDEHNWSRKPGEPRAYYQDQIRQIIEHGGMIIYAHPGGTWVPPGPYTYEEGPLGWSDEIQWMADEGYLHGVESRAQLEPDRRDSSFRWALEHGLTLLDVTDVHGPRNFDRAGQAPVTLVFAREATEEAAMDALWAGRTLTWRDGLLRGKQEWLVPFMDAIIEVGVTQQNGEPRLKVTNKSALGLYGTVQTAGSHQLWLAPFSSHYLPGPASMQSISIRWGNVQHRPGGAFSSEHPVRTDHVD